MFRFDTLFAAPGPLRLLVLGAHSDDIEIGCGGTLFRLLNRGDCTVRWVVFGCHGARLDEARESAEEFLSSVEASEIELLQFRDGFFPYQGAEIKEHFEELKRRVSPDVILTHTRSDLHQDHRLLCELTWNTFRDHLILEYEVPKFDGDLGRPNVFVELDESISEKKVHHLMAHFESQQQKHWYDEQTFYSLLRLRGVECGAQFAEAFTCRKVVLG